MKKKYVRFYKPFIYFHDDVKKSIYGEYYIFNKSYRYRYDDYKSAIKNKNTVEKVAQFSDEQFEQTIIELLSVKNKRDIVNMFLTEVPIKIRIRQLKCKQLNKNSE